jgi:hypothetical protein
VSLVFEPRYRELVKMAEDLELHRFQDFGGHKQWLRSSRQSAWREVEQHFDDYTRRHPQSARAWFNLGYARIEGDRAREAVPAFRHALDLGYRKPKAPGLSRMRWSATALSSGGCSASSPRV